MNRKFSVRYSVLLLSLPLILFSCKFQFVPEYSSVIEAKIIKGAQLNDELYIDLLAMPANNRTYSSYLDRYEKVEAEINSIQLLMEARDKNKDFLIIVKNLKDAFLQYRDDHKTKSILNDPEVKLYQEYIKAFWKPLLRAEMGLKNQK